jgi:hypothetical protein
VPGVRLTNGLCGARFGPYVTVPIWIHILDPFFSIVELGKKSPLSRPAGLPNGRAVHSSPNRLGIAGEPNCGGSPDQPTGQ